MKSKVVLLFTFFCIFSTNIFSQGFPWLVNVEGGSSIGEPVPTDVAYDQSGHIYVTGYFENSALIGNTNLSGTASEGFLAKLTEDGSVVWTQSFGGNEDDAGVSVVTDNAGGVYVSGVFQSTAQFGSLSATASISSPTFDTENFLVKYDTAGNPVWLKNGGNAGGFSTSTDYNKSRLDFKNGTLLLGALYEIPSFGGGSVNDRTFDGIVFPQNTGNSAGANTFVVSMDTAGNINWSNTIRSEGSSFSTESYIKDVKLMSSGDALVLTLSEDTTIIGSNTVINSPSASLNIRYNALIKFDGSNGNYISNHLLPNQGFSIASRGLIALTSSDDIFISTTRNSSTPQSLLGTPLPSSGSFIYKLTSNLTPYDVEILTNGSTFTGLNAVSSIDIDNQGALFISGLIDGQLTISGATINEQRELYFIKTDTGFTQLTWSVTSNKPVNNFQVPSMSGADIGTANQVYFCGNVAASNTEFGTQLSSSTSFNNGFVTKIVDCAPLNVSVSPSNPVICGGAASTSLTATSSPNFDYQWISGASEIAGANNVSYSASSPGTYSVRVDSLGCLDTSNVVSVTQEPSPNVDVPNTTLSLCSQSAPIVLQGGTPAGGVWSGTGVVNDSVFDPSLVGSGPVLLTYTYTSTGGCSDSDVRIANVVSPPALSVSSSIPDFCEGDQSVSMSSYVSPIGGTYSGPGVSNNQFYPDSAGVGTHVITYTYSAIQGCDDSTTFNIVVNPSPTINYPTYSPVCNSTFSIPLNSASPSGGTYSGNFVVSNTFYPFLSGPGTFPVTYTVTQNGCTSTATESIQVDAPVTPTLSNVGPFCTGDDSVVLNQGSPSGGTYYLNNTAVTSIDPGALGVGSYQLEYVFSNACGSDTATENFDINQTPTVSFSSIGDFCENDSPINIAGGSPSGGTYSGPGISGNTFDPSQAQLGANSIVYTYTNSGGCSASDSIITTVYSQPTISFNNPDSVCLNSGAINLSASPSGGTYSGTGVTGNSFDPQVTGSGSQIISYSFTNSNNCSTTSFDTIEVVNPSAPTLQPLQAVCEGSSVINLTGGSPTGGTYSGQGVSNGQFDPSSVSGGTYDIVYSINTVCGTLSDTQQIVVNPKPQVTLPSLTDRCIDAGVVTLPQGTPSGGTYSGPGVTGSQFDPSVAGVGTHDIVYSFTNTNGCTGSDTQQVEVNPLPTVSFSGLSDVCISSSSITLTGGTPTGGTYSGTGVTGTQFDPSVAGVGTHVITYSFTDANGCSGSDTTSITVNPLPNVTFTSPGTFCESDAAINLTSGTPTGGTYSGIGVTGNQFDPSAAGVGTYSLVYSYSDPNGCSDTAMTTVTVNPKPQVTLPSLSDRCIDAGVVTLPTGSPSGGTYSGPGVTGNQFDPSVAGVGTHDIVYSFTNTNGCTGSDTQQVEVNPLPTVSFSGLSDVCIGSGVVSLTTGTPTGGTYSGTGVTGTQFDPSVAGVGTHVITYSFTDANGCSGSDTTSITVNPLPNVTFTSPGTFCESDAAITLTGGSPTVGTYSGTGVTGNQFDPSVAGVGTYSLVYTYSDPNGCSDTAMTTVTVNPKPQVTLPSLSDRCIDAGVVTLPQGTPSGGSYSGPGVTGNQFDPSVAGVGTHNIVYSFTSTNGCTGTDTQQVEVNPLPTVSFSGLSDVCISSNSITLTGGTPTGGTYSGPGVTGTQFDPSVAGVGMHVITYSFTDGNGCSDSDTTTITVNPLPTVSFTSPGTFCESDAAITLTGGSPTGGTYSGTGVTGNQFDPSAAGVGTYSLVYTYSDPNGCSDTAMTTVTVNPKPQVTLPSLSDRCIDAGVVTLPAGSPTGGTCSGPGVTGNQFDPSVAGVGTHAIVYSFTNTNGCTGSDTQQVEVNPLPTVSLDLDTAICESTDTLLLSGETPQGGIFSGNGVTGNTFNISQAGLGTTVVQYEFTDSNGCLNTDSGTVEVLGNPSVSLGSDIDICEGLQDTLVATGASNYTWSNGSQLSSIIVSPTNDTSYSVVGEGSNGCLGYDTIEVTVLESPRVELNEIDTVCADTVFSIDAGSGYSSYLWNNGETTQSIDVGPFVHDTAYSYAVVVQNNDGCLGSDTVSFEVIDCEPSGVITEDPRSVKLYPNPNNGVFVVESEEWYGDAKVEVISSTGVLVHKSNISDQSYWKKRFDLSEVSNGIYFFTIKTSSKIFQKQIIINR